MTTLLYLIACLMSPSPLINLAESRVVIFPHKATKCLSGKLETAVPQDLSLIQGPMSEAHAPAKGDFLL